MYFRLIQRRALSQSIARRSHETTKVSSKVNLDNYQAKIQANTPYHFYQNQVLDDYIAQPVSASTLQYYIFFGKQMNKSRLIKSANWVRNELLVRLAHRIRDFQQLPFFVGYNPHIEYVYKLHWGIFETIRRFPTIQKHEENLQFCQLCDGLLEGGLRVLPRLARGLSESAAYYPPEQKDLDLFLNRMLRSKISRNLLTEQHIALTEAYEHQQGHSDGLENDNIGIIYMHCSARESVKRAKALVYQHVKRYHNDGNSENWKPPAIEVTLENNGNSGEILFAYVSILYILRYYRYGEGLIHNRYQSTWSIYYMSCSITP
jgi:hypothetical protein